MSLELTGLAPVSVIIPCYNCCGTIERALSSVLLQTCEPERIVLIDDCSTDETLDKLRCLAGADERIIVVETDRNRGPASARNRGLELVESEFVAFLDADDSWHPRKLEIQLTAFSAFPSAAACGHLMSHGAAPESVLYRSGQMPALREFSQLRWLLRNRYATSSVLIRRARFGGFAESKRCSEDYLAWLEMILTGAQCIRVEAPLGQSYKRSFGESGLSANLWTMEKGQLDTYRRLCSSGLLTQKLTALASVVSLLKFLRRVCITSFHHV